MTLLKTKPQWLDKKIDIRQCLSVQNQLADLDLHTVCHQARCPNMSECFEHGHATFLILGKVCTRACAFCAVEKGVPAALDTTEPQRVAEAARRLKLKHVVITSVTRDDLADGGAAMFVETVRALRSLKPVPSVELLIPDFQLNRQSIETVVSASPQVLAHNLETVPRLYADVRPQSASGHHADYNRSLEVLRIAKQLAVERGSAVRTKSGIMLGLGEKQDEVEAVMADLIAAGCEQLSIGQYLAPSMKHAAVKDYILPRMFEFYRMKAQSMGFKQVMSGPYVRSSYRSFS